MSDLYREITDEERRTWSATRFACINAAPVRPVILVTVDREDGAITYDPTDLFDLPSGRYALFPLEARR